MSAVDDLGQFQLGHERRLANCESWIKQHQEDIERLDKQQGDIKDLISSVATIAQKQADMDAKIGRVESKMDEVSAKGGKRWETIVEKIIGALVAGLVTYALLQIGLG